MLIGRHISKRQRQLFLNGDCLATLWWIPAELTALADERHLGLALLLVPPALVRDADNGTALEDGGPAHHPVPEGGGALVGPRPPVPEEADPDGDMERRSEDWRYIGHAFDFG